MAVATKRKVPRKNLREIWTGNDPAEETILLSLPSLARALKRMGVLAYSHRTYDRWVEKGVIANGKRIKLRTKKIGSVRHSTVKWVKDFLDQQPD